MLENKVEIFRTRKQSFFLILMLGALNTLTPISIDMYLPAFPKIANDLHTSIEKVALSVSTYFLGFAIGQIFYGPLLDRYGRKGPLYLGIGLYVIASLGCISFNSIEALLLIRFIQAFGGSVASVAAMAMVRDFFPVDKSSRIISLLILILGVSPLLAPTIGSFVVVAWGWRMVFVLLAGISVLMAFFVFSFLPEGHDPDPSVSLTLPSILNEFKIILLNRRFLIYTLAGSFSFATLFVYVAGSPAIFMKEFHLSPKAYGGVFALLSVSFIGGSQMNHFLTRKYRNDQIFKVTLIFQVIVSALFLIFEFLRWDGLPGVICFLSMLLLCAGLTFPNAAAVALAPFTKNSGSASALLGFMQIGIGGLISSGVGALDLEVSLASALIMAFSSWTAISVLLFL
jgi:DHA1 family bicyclomycin/chloramphenicol resistance-like MFS transporter